MTLSSKGRGIGPWGEGFADDAWADVAAVDRWTMLDPDEYIRLFPRLAVSGRLADPVLDRLAEAIAVRAWRLRRCGARLPTITGLATAAIETIGATREDDWFPRPSRMRAVIDRVLHGARVAAVADASDETAIHVLDPLLAAVRGGMAPPFTEAAALAVAFHAGLHPAYVWEAALTVHDCATAAGWLGILARGRAAFMPLDVAMVLDDAIDRRDGRAGRLRDPRLGLCHFAPSQWAAIGASARRRLSGRCGPIRLAVRRPVRVVAPPGAIDAARLPASVAPR